VRSSQATGRAPGTEGISLRGLLSHSCDAEAIYGASSGNSVSSALPLKGCESRAGVLCIEAAIPR
jgi:hypothetical protein